MGLSGVCVQDRGWALLDCRCLVSFGISWVCLARGDTTPAAAWPLLFVCSEGVPQALRRDHAQTADLRAQTGHRKAKAVWQHGVQGFAPPSPAPVIGAKASFLLLCPPIFLSLGRNRGHQPWACPLTSRPPSCGGGGGRHHQQTDDGLQCRSGRIVQSAGAPSVGPAACSE
jgi:hypothetical protein